MAESARSGAGQPTSARDALLEKALFDPLTGLRNRHHLESYPAHPNGRRCNEEPVSCLMIDIDHFKKHQMTAGHEAGDQVIKSVASNRTTRRNTARLAFRYGGERVSVLLSGVDEEAAQACAKEIYNGVHELSLRYGLSEIGLWMCRLASPAIRSTLRAITCCALPTWPYTGRKSWAVRVGSFGMLEAG